MQYTTTDAIIIFFVTIAAIIGVFYLIRTVLLWYWKVDTIVKNQELQIMQMSTQNSLLEKFIKQAKPELTESPKK